jgi:hypothetical protein
MSTGSVSAQGQKTDAAAETVQKRENSTRKNCATRKRMCSKLSAVLATPNFQQKNKKLQISKRNLSEKCLLSCSQWSVHCKMK